MTIKTNHPYVVKDRTLKLVEPVIKGTKTRVRSIVEQWRLGTHPEELTIHFPHLNLAQIFDALSYYFENQDEINDFIRKNRVSADLVHPFVKEIDE